MEVTIIGLDELNAKLKKLSGRQGKNALRRAMTKGAAQIRDQARANAMKIDDPATARSISRNIAAYNGGQRRERAVGGLLKRIGVRGGARYIRTKDGQRAELPGGNTTHWRFVELGTSKTRAQPFLIPAMYQASQSAYQATAQAVFPELEKEINKL